MTDTTHAADPAPRRALLVIDVQNEYISGKLPIGYPSPDVSLPNIGAAMDAANAAGVPVIVVQHTAPADSPVFADGSDGWQLHPVVTQRSSAHHISKNMPSVFAGTDLGAWLSEHGIDTLTVAGYMTQNCNASTIFAAAHLGIDAEYLHDASGALPYANAGGSASAEEVHRVFCSVFHARYAAVVSTAQWIAAVQTGAAFEQDNIVASFEHGVAMA